MSVVNGRGPKRWDLIIAICILGTRESGDRGVGRAGLRGVGLVAPRASRPGLGRA